MIYFISADELNAVKIGESDTPKRRISEIQVSIPYRLELLGVIGDPSITIRTIYSKFAHLRMQGEWFAKNNELKVFIESELTKLPRAAPKKEVKTYNSFGEYLVSIKASPTGWARGKGLPAATIWRLFHGKGFPAPATVRAIEKATDGAVRPEDWY